MTNIQQNIAVVLQRIAMACNKVDRKPESVTLLAVSKTVSVAAIEEAITAGQMHFGENYVAEGVEKIKILAARNLGHQLVWHCIGPIQSNKTQLVATHFDWVHSVDKLKTAERLSAQRPPQSKPLQVCIQVNVDAGANKSGVAPDEVLPLTQAIAKLPHLTLRGIMVIPEPAIDLIAAKAIFMRARAIFDHINTHGFQLDTLSMGMSEDIEPAIFAGSTMVRVGSAIFGRRA